MEIDFDKNGYVTCNGFRIHLTREQVMDLQMYGYDSQNLIEEIYKKDIAYIRDQKIDKLLELDII